MGREKNEIGKRGEGIAAEFLTGKGYEILERNSRTVFGEIDIVARYKSLMIFVEVKTRASSSLGPPLLSVSRCNACSMDWPKARRWPNHCSLSTGCPRSTWR